MNRHRLHKKPVITAIFALAFATIFSAISPSQTFAVTPPDSCFNITASGYITAYYNNEGNNSANPACPKDVDIPSQIGGVTVVGISGYQPFYNKQLTSVTFPSTLTTIQGTRAFANNLLTSVVIPNSVTSMAGTDHTFTNNLLTSVTLSNAAPTIPDSAFTGNQLTSITIPSSVTTIGAAAFFGNNLITVTIPSSVTTIDSFAFGFNKLTSVTIAGTPTIGSVAFVSNGADWTTSKGLTYSSNPAASSPQSDYIQSTASIVPVYMPNGVGSTTSSVGYIGSSSSGNGNTNNNWQGWGGQLINPAQLTVQYKDTNGNTIAPSVTEVGDGLADYKLKTLYDIYGSWPTLTNADALTHYYLTGTTVSKTAPTVAGYTLSSLSAQTMSLNTGANTMTFTYKANSDSDNDGAGSADDTETPAAPNTGLRTSIVSNPAITVSGLVLIGAVVIVLRRRFVR